VALSEAMNQRNLLTLEALDRARRFVLEAEAPEERPAELAGEGTWENPFEIDSLPFVDDRDTTTSQTSNPLGDPPALPGRQPKFDISGDLKAEPPS
jgi:hypothetical protein